MTRVTPDPHIDRVYAVSEDVMVKRSVDSQDQPVASSGSAATAGLASSSLHTVIRDGKPGIKEVLGNYQRISTITFILFITIVLLSLSAMFLLLTEAADYRWQRIVSGEDPFPVVNTSKTKTYFEGTKLKDTPIGKLIYYRRNWKSLNVEFGLARHVGVQLAQVIIMLTIVLFCIIHLLSACLFTRCRRKFQLISLSHGFVGLFNFALCLTTLYFGFVHKVASYLENAQHPPYDFIPTPDNKTVRYFESMCYACAFAFSKPNVYVKQEYKAHLPFPEDASFTIENITYSKQEMMDLGICPRQDYLLISVFILGVTTLCSWIAASYSELLENKILGPPVWLQRFKVHIHNGIRHWQTRKKIPSYLHVHRREEAGSSSGDPDYLDDQAAMELGAAFDKHAPTWEDAYDVLDGGMDHILLLDPFINRGASRHRLYRSTTSISHL